VLQSGKSGLSLRKAARFDGDLKGVVINACVGILTINQLGIVEHFRVQRGKGLLTD
jgi:hypothetical protein